ncbi:MAG: hypothetical protein V4656_17170 [Pseudomonadota bacterium]
MAAPSPSAIAAAASDMLLMSLHSDLDIWIDHAADQLRGKSPEAQIAAHVFERLHETRTEVEAMIARLAVQIAAKEAADAAELEDA